MLILNKNNNNIYFKIWKDISSIFRHLQKQYMFMYCYFFTISRNMYICKTIIP